VNITARGAGGIRVAVGGADVTRSEFEELVERHHADLVRLAFAMSGDRAAAEDAVQACWDAAWRSRAEIREPARMRGWLFTVTANEVRRQMRRDRLRGLLQGRLRGPKPLPAIDVPRLDLASALTRISVADRELLAMRYGLGLTSAEIAGHVGLSAPGVRRRLQRVLVRMRKELGDD
jgi:DNA-directed RNA polymerase specialized sigma24 family protein